MSSGGESIRMCGLSAFSRCGIACFETMKVPRALIWCIRSKRRMSVCCTLVSWIALALLTTISMPPNFSAVASKAFFTFSSSRTSTTSGSARPPACSISCAAEWIVPGSFGCGVSVFAATAMLAPSRAAFSAIASPMPREAPVMNSVLPLSDMRPPGFRANGACGARLAKCAQSAYIRRDKSTLDEAYHAAHRYPSSDRDLGRRAGQQAFLHRHDGHAHGQEDRQPGRHERVSPVLCRRARAARHRPHFFRLAGAARAARYAFDRAHGLAHRRPGKLSVVEGASQRSRREVR